ncbi:putative F-box domain-containing protein [Helianthus annuus]|uniref:F-box domain-containing protein n=1 Tax=Helianthus annuus TaxID=4232 RepID=A0A9K3EIE5_HELAN|nr:putative F-box domain-containing protein [Helianthus annuus]KAJ0477124.1 putative F-box domain-containing protein [Helianthus annuus]KAJ0481512.1 putative F-box domain-containing protein [Helianthus annuus]KAJ0497962.1 putative F-box domain-containing protein [Helianthus annuus]KAJ0663965.1 putative F-box domain-containing protein [Helianthus annuus]
MTPKMVNKRAKINKTCFSEALMAKSTESGAIVGSSDDLLTEILRRLPVTSILRFKSVSKHWNSLLSHRRFTLLYDNVLVSPGLFLRDFYIPFDVENPTPPPFRSLNFYPDRSGIKIVQTMLLPDRRSWSHGARSYYFGESEGHVHLVEDARQGNPLHINVYEMLSDYSGWFVKYQVELDELPTAYPFTVYISNQDPSKYEFEVVDVVMDEEESTFIVVRTREKIIRYNVHSKSFKQIFDLKFDLPSCYRICTTDFHRYTQYLSSF